MDDRRKLELAGWALAAFVAVFLVARLLHRGAPEAAPVAVSASPARAPAAAKLSVLVVDVEGQVARPGLQRVPAGSRAGVAVDAAGGLPRHGDATAVNLAAPLHDGQQIVVPKRGGAVAVAQAGAPADPAAPTGPISLSSASVAQLDTLDGIGPTLAQRIVKYREAHGGFRSVEELKQVEGIGEKRFAALRRALQP